MTSFAGPPHNKRQKKDVSLSSSSSLSLLPHDVALNCLSRLSRLDSAVLSLTSKSYSSLVVSPDFCRTRELMGCTEEYWYVCLSIPPDPTPRWFILRRGGPTLDDVAFAAKKSVNWLLRPIPSYPYQPPESSSFVGLNFGIYVIGGIVQGNPTSDVLLLDCVSHSWRRIQSMKVARASAAANVVDGKIYGFGGCQEVNSPNWAEVFDPKTQTWDSLPLPKDPDIRRNTSVIDRSVVMEDKIYAVDEEDQSFYYLPREGIWRRGNRDSKPGNRKNWCAIGKLLYCCGTRGQIMWCEPNELERCGAEELNWGEVEGLGILQWCEFGLKAKNRAMDETLAWELHWTVNGFSRLSSNSRGNIVAFWKVLIPCTNKLELWCAEISMERRQGGEIWGTIEWADTVSKLDPKSYTVKVLYSLSLNV
ncbi:PREDICTED: putative F-box/kelch-repeat protein At3g24610 [Camelina sativa]|uniref:F-box/kelch-repeat protein At3g24610 n=1 Tax=Camelina sativa TaxID=90675 RepID=A0ABM0Y7A3_CAMSA|nr:PREDICTED: putative F-box/kelch-repeat protein At3g24610 [Camelina sativa]